LRSKFLLVKHSTLFKMLHCIWIFIGLLLVNSWWNERHFAHAEEKVGLERTHATSGVGESLKRLGSRFFGYFASWAVTINDKCLWGGHTMLLPPQLPDPYGRPVRTVVVNFESTLVSSEWTRDSGWIVSKRPYVSAFLEKLARCGYEVVLFTDQNQMDCEQSVMDLDQTGVIRHRLFKDSTNFARLHSVKDLNRLGRDMRNVVMIDHDYATSGVLTPDNCIPISPWKNDLSDKELYGLAVLLEKCQKYNVGDLREIVRRYKANPRGNPFVEEEKRADEQERLLREEEGSPKKTEPRKTTQSDTNKSVGGLGATLTGLFGRK